MDNIDHFLINKINHCLKVLGLVALKIALYLLWLALGIVLRMGN